MWRTDRSIISLISSLSTQRSSAEWSDTNDLLTGTCAARHVTERDSAVERLLPWHAQDPLAEHVARHLRGAAGDAADLPHEEIDAAVGERPTVVEPRSPGCPSELEHDRSEPLRRHAVEEASDRRRLVRQRAGRDTVSDAFVEVSTDRLEGLEFPHEEEAPRVG